MMPVPSGFSVPAKIPATWTVASRLTVIGTVSAFALLIAKVPLPLVTAKTFATGVPKVRAVRPGFAALSWFCVANVRTPVPPRRRTLSAAALILPDMVVFAEAPK